MRKSTKHMRLNLWITFFGMIFITLFILSFAFLSKNPSMVYVAGFTFVFGMGMTYLMYWLNRDLL